MSRSDIIIISPSGWRTSVTVNADGEAVLNDGRGRITLTKKDLRKIIRFIDVQRSQPEQGAR